MWQACLKPRKREIGIWRTRRSKPGLNVELIMDYFCHRYVLVRKVRLDSLR